jgi:hypothetical protein
MNKDIFWSFCLSGDCCMTTLKDAMEVFLHFTVQQVCSLMGNKTLYFASLATVHYSAPLPIPEDCKLHIHRCGNLKCRSQWPRGLKHEPSWPARTLGSWVRIPLEAWMSVCIFLYLRYSVCRQGLCDGLIPRPRSPTDCL